MCWRRRSGQVLDPSHTAFDDMKRAKEPLGLDPLQLLRLHAETREDGVELSDFQLPWRLSYVDLLYLRSGSYFVLLFDVESLGHEDLIPTPTRWPRLASDSRLEMSENCKSSSGPFRAIIAVPIVVPTILDGRVGPWAYFSVCGALQFIVS